MKHTGPPPYYVTEVLSEEPDRLVAHVVFPSTDPSLAQRKRANTAHQMVAVWNLAHHALRACPYGNPLVRSQSSTHEHVIERDKVYILTMQGGVDEASLRGEIEATFTDQDGRIYSTFNVEFSCRPIVPTAL